MKRRTHVVFTGCFLMGVAACGELPIEPQSLAEPAFNQSPGRQILMRDACDPVSFNAVMGPGFCNRSAQGGIPFETFIQQLQEHQRVEAWRFAPAEIHVTRTTTFTVPNVGGIPHSFTEVAEFGGGIVPLLNALSGNPVPAPECLDFANLVLVPPGGHDVVTVHPGESRKYMCCIHPWMRAESN